MRRDSESGQAAACDARVAAVVVTYFPDRNALQALLLRLGAGLDFVVVVDNSPRDCRSAEFVYGALQGGGDFRLLRLGENLGIAAAINIGIDAARHEGVHFILISDQDSLPAESMVSELLAAHDTLTARGERVAALGPTFFDSSSGAIYPFQTVEPGKFFYGRRYATDEHPYVDTISLISSGSLIPVEALVEVGKMLEPLFIDCVDTEWCHRARAKQLKLFGVHSAKMHHQMGEKRLRVWYRRWRNEQQYPPTRLYYRVRNQLYLFRLPHVPRRWWIRSSWFILGVVYSHILFGNRKAESLRMAASGFFDAVRGRLGPHATIAADRDSDPSDGN